MRSHHYHRLVSLAKKVKKGIVGFTLIESLIVVGILGLLAGITISAINPSEALKSSHDAVRKQDLNTLHKAFLLYIPVAWSDSYRLS